MYPSVVPWARSQVHLVRVAAPESDGMLHPSQVAEDLLPGPGGQAGSQRDGGGGGEAGVAQRLVERVHHLLAVLPRPRPGGEPWTNTYPDKYTRQCALKQFR